jgi:hypothetical protein
VPSSGDQAQHLSAGWPTVGLFIGIGEAMVRTVRVMGTCQDCTCPWVLIACRGGGEGGSVAEGAGGREAPGGLHNWVYRPT